MTDLLTSIQAALGLPNTPIPFTANGALPSAFAVTDLACASIGAAGQAISELLNQQTGRLPTLEVDRRLASFWFATSIRPVGWSVPPLWDPVAGDYATQDGWIRLHTNAPHHRAAAETVLGACADRPAMASKVAQWAKSDLEHAVVEAGGCAAEMRSWQQWQAHPQGQAVNAEPLIQFAANSSQNAKPWQGSVAQPLAGIKVLDLTRVLAGPVASRFLAGLGADVLRIDPRPGTNRAWCLKSRWANAARAWTFTTRPIASCSKACSRTPTFCSTATAPMHSSAWVTASPNASKWPLA